MDESKKLVGVRGQARLTDICTIEAIGGNATTSGSSSTRASNQGEAILLVSNSSGAVLSGPGVTLNKV